MLTVFIDPHGQVLIDIRKVLAELRRSDSLLQVANLRSISYSQLVLCTTAIASPSNVTLEDIAYEKALRRKRFLNMDEASFRECTRYLKAEGMYEDLLLERVMMSSPTWDSLTHLQRLWARLECLHTHLDDYKPRLKDTETLLLHATQAGSLEPIISNDFRLRLLDIARKNMPTDKLRRTMSSLLIEIEEYLSSEELELKKLRLIRNYQCSADCFHVTTGVTV
jgi:hypothetical protein